MPRGVYERRRAANRFCRPAGVNATEGIPDPGARAVDLPHSHALRTWEPEILEARAPLIQAAHSDDPHTSYLAQQRLVLEYNLVLPLQALRLPRELRDRLTDQRPVGPIQPARCLRCGGRLRDGTCEGRYIRAQEDGKGMRWQRCQAVWT